MNVHLLSLFIVSVLFGTICTWDWGHLLCFKYVTQINSSDVCCLLYGAFQIKRDALWTQRA
jgi:hypothetical protein